MIKENVEKILGFDGTLSQKLDGFEYRPQQIEMAQAVEEAFNKAQHLIVEAGTGTGKSLAYLIPATLWAIANNKKVVISTYTKTLQQQILKYDIPFLREKLGIPFRYALCMGNENYLSLRRLKRSTQAGLFNKSEEEKQWNTVFDWAGKTETGYRHDLPFEVMPQVWEEVGRQKDLCLGKNCETYSSCFYFKERKKWFSAHLLIVNHHLFFANVANSGAVLPQFDAVVFDEAQNLEEAATQFLGLEISNSKILYFFFNLLDGERGLFSYFKKNELLKDLQIEEAELTNKIKNLEFKNSLLSDKLDLDYVETLIREKFLFGKEGETLYIIKNNEN